jgi:hypothetical protein
MKFSVQVSAGGVGVGKGKYEVEVLGNGLKLVRPGKLPIVISVGARVTSNPKATLHVATDRHDFEMRVLGFTIANQSLADELAKFLTRRAPPPDPAQYRIPVYLFILAALPFGILAITRGGSLWGWIAGTLFLAGVIVAKRHDLPLAARAAVLAIMNLLTYGTVIAVIVTLLRLSNPGAVPATASRPSPSARSAVAPQSIPSLPQVKSQDLPQRLVEIRHNQPLAAGDQILIPLTTNSRNGDVESYWRASIVNEVLPSGAVQVLVEEDAMLGIYERWELRRLEPKSAANEPNEAARGSPAQAEHYHAVEALRREKLAQAIAATTWPQHELVALDPKVPLRPAVPVYAPFQSRMQEVCVVKKAGSAFWFQPTGNQQVLDGPAIVRRSYELHQRVRKPYKAMREPLDSFAQAYGRFVAAFQRPPETWSELEAQVPSSDYRPLETAVRQAFETHGFAPVLGVAQWEMLRASAARGEASDDRRLAGFVFAHPKTASEEGGLILMADASVKEWSAEEFRANFATQTKALDSLRADFRKKALATALGASTDQALVELSQDESPQRGDTVFVPRGGKMVAVLVTESLPGGQVRVDQDGSHRLTYDRWELRKLARAEPGSALSADEREALRQASLTASLKAFAAAYTAFARQHNAAPETWNDIRSASKVDELESHLKEADYDVVLGVQSSEMVGGRENFVLAYPRDAKSKGGVVVMATGAARKMTAAAFDKLLSAQLAAVANQRVSSRRSRIAPKSQAQAQMLRAYADAWLNFWDLSQRGPANWNELTSKDLATGLESQFEAAGFQAVFGLKRRDISSRPVILAFPKDASKKGGYVVRADGAVREFLAEEFRILFAEQSSELAGK